MHNEPPTSQEETEQKFYAQGQKRRDPPTMMEDDRTIKSCHFYRHGSYEVGEEGVTEIVAYTEQGNGEMVMIPYIAVYKSGEIATRIPAHQLAEINYWTEHDDELTEQRKEELDEELPF